MIHFKEIKRGDGGALSLTEQFILLELFTTQGRPTPYSEEELKKTLGGDNPGMLELHASFKRRDDEDVDDIPCIEYDDVVFVIDAHGFNLNTDADGIWDQILDSYFSIDRLMMREHLSNIIGSDWKELSIVPFYNCLSPAILSWKDLNKNPDNVHIVPHPTDYNYKYCGNNTCYIEQLEVFWMIAVNKFGEYGTSPRTGWIMSENWDKFCMWCDAVCHSDIICAMECLYISNPNDNLKNYQPPPAPIDWSKAKPLDPVIDLSEIKIDKG